MRLPLLPLLIPVLAGLLSCHAPAGAPPPEPAASPSGPPGYTLVFLKTGPRSGKLPKEENEAAFAGHFANMERMAKAGELLVAGPFGEKRHDPALRGIFVLASAERAEAEAWAGTDPTTRAGVFTLEFHDLATDAPLARALHNDLDRLERQEAEGRKPAPGEGARPYVLLFAEHGDLARRELAPLRDAEGGVFLLADLDGTRALAVLDAATQAEAAERFAPQLEALGAHTLDEWFATDELARMLAPAD